ncbi:MAG TPA: DUF2007 domain-containing protein [Polyangia bacterium]|jgi:hypothetical protein
MAESFESVFASTATIEVQMLAEVLVRNGIDARIIGSSHAEMFGAAQLAAPLRIEVPASRAAEARELIAALQTEPGAGAAPTDGEAGEP